MLKELSASKTFSKNIIISCCTTIAYNHSPIS
jgi:hypothetical protein